MTRQTKLQKLIEIAVENGWEHKDVNKFDEIYQHHTFGLGWTQIMWDSMFVTKMLFSHDFAKAIWGEEQHRFGRNIVGTLKEWEWRIQEAVISDDPLEYYWKNKLKKEAS